jgi:hypothetical protein
MNCPPLFHANQAIILNHSTGCYAQLAPEAPANNSPKRLTSSHFWRFFRANNVVTIFFQKILVTTTGSVKFSSFPYGKGFWAGFGAQKLEKRPLFVVIRPLSSWK